MTKQRLKVVHCHIQKHCYHTMNRAESFAEINWSSAFGLVDSDDEPQKFISINATQAFY